MTAPRYHTITKGLIVKPVTEPIFSEQAFTVELDDEAAGLFLVIAQSGKDGEQKISLTVEEWPTLRMAIEDMLGMITRAEQEKVINCGGCNEQDTDSMPKVRTA